VGSSITAMMRAPSSCVAPISSFLFIRAGDAGVWVLRPDGSDVPEPIKPAVVLALAGARWRARVRAWSSGERRREPLSLSYSRALQQSLPRDLRAHLEGIQSRF
jgi:hypothetical protein